MKSNSLVRPLVFHDLKNGAWHYNYNITESQRTDESGQVTPSYDYDQVQIWGTPSKKEVIKEVIAANWDVTQELDLVNDNKRYELGIANDITLRDRYIAYLNAIDAFKQMVESDFTDYAHQLNQ